MQMVGHIVYGNRLVPLGGDDAGDVFLQFVIVFRRDEILPAFNGKHDVQINLRVGICHLKYAAPTELKYLFVRGFLQICRAYGAGNHSAFFIHNSAFVFTAQAVHQRFSE